MSCNLLYNIASSTKLRVKNSTACGIEPKWLCNTLDRTLTSDRRIPVLVYFPFIQWVVPFIFHLTSLHVFVKSQWPLGHQGWTGQSLYSILLCFLHHTLGLSILIRCLPISFSACLPPPPPLFFPPCTVPCRNIFASPVDLVMYPYHFNFLFSHSGYNIHLL